MAVHLDGGTILMTKNKRKKNNARSNGWSKNRRQSSSNSLRNGHRSGTYRPSRSILGASASSWRGSSITLSERFESTKPKHIPLREKFKITPEAFGDLVNSVGTERCESGGILLGSRVDFVVRKYVHDPYGCLLYTSPSPRD